MKEENKIELIEKSDFLEQPEDNKKDELMKDSVPKEEEKKKLIREKEKEKIKEDIKDEENEEDEEDEEDEEEKMKLLEEENKEKERLNGIIVRLKEDLDSKKYKTLRDIYEQYLNNEDMTKR